MAFMAEIKIKKKLRHIKGKDKRSGHLTSTKTW